MVGSAPGPTGSAYSPWANQQQCKEAQSVGNQKWSLSCTVAGGEGGELADVLFPGVFWGMFQQQCNRGSSRRFYRLQYCKKRNFHCV